MGEFTIKNGVLESYYGDENQKGLVVPKGVVEIGHSAFMSQENMGVITLPEGVKRIRDSAFSDCFGMPEVKLPESLTHLEIHAFFYSDIKKITLPRGLKYIGRAALGDCMFLEKIIYKGTVAEFNRIEKDLPIVTSHTETKIVNCTDGTVTLSDF